MHEHRRLVTHTSRQLAGYLVFACSGTSICDRNPHRQSDHGRVPRAVRVSCHPEQSDRLQFKFRIRAACAQHGYDLPGQRAVVSPGYIARLVGGGLCADHSRRGVDRRGTGWRRRRFAAPSALTRRPLQQRQAPRRHWRRAWFSRLVLRLYGGWWRMVRDVAVAPMERTAGCISLLHDAAGRSDLRQPAGHRWYWYRIAKRGVRRPSIRRSGVPEPAPPRPCRRQRT
jgi:hypothetical protein